MSGVSSRHLPDFLAVFPGSSSWHASYAARQPVLTWTESPDAARHPVRPVETHLTHCTDCIVIPVNTKHLYNICTTLAQRLRRWTNIVQMLYKYFVFPGMGYNNYWHWLHDNGWINVNIDGAGWSKIKHFFRGSIASDFHEILQGTICKSFGNNPGNVHLHLSSCLPPAEPG